MKCEFETCCFFEVLVVNDDYVDDLNIDDSLVMTLVGYDL